MLTNNCTVLPTYGRHDSATAGGFAGSAKALRRKSEFRRRVEASSKVVKACRSSSELVEA